MVYETLADGKHYDIANAIRWTFLKTHDVGGTFCMFCGLLYQRHLNPLPMGYEMHVNVDSMRHLDPDDDTSPSCGKIQNGKQAIRTERRKEEKEGKTEEQRYIYFFKWIEQKAKQSEQSLQEWIPKMWPLDVHYGILLGSSVRQLFFDPLYYHSAQLYLNEPTFRVAQVVSAVGYNSMGVVRPSPVPEGAGAGQSWTGQHLHATCRG
ncbi:hypothetical protein NPIL_484351, partial [Nephila pilipes]